MSDYTTVTETWGLSASPEQLSMQYCRYRIAGELATGRRVLEVGCGTGMGLPYLRERAAITVGGDYTNGIIKQARAHLPDANLVRFDAHRLPFSDASFDVLLMLEMVYYLNDQEAALRECRRVLRPGGHLFMCMPNPDRPDFNPSPFAVRYLDVPSLAQLLMSTGFEVEVMGGFPIDEQSQRDNMLAPIRQFAVRHHLIPRSMRLKSLVKRVLYGQLPKLGAVREGMAAYVAPVAIDPKTKSARFKNLYAVGTAA